MLGVSERHLQTGMQVKRESAMVTFLADANPVRFEYAGGFHSVNHHPLDLRSSTMSRPSIRDQIAAKRAEASKTPARRIQDVGAAVSAAQARGFGSASTDRLDDKTISGQVKKAARSGTSKYLIA